MECGTLDLSSVSGISAAAFGIVSRIDLNHIAVLIFLAACALNEICALKSALGTVGEQSLVLGNGLFHEVLGLNIEFTGESDLSCSAILVVGIVLNVKLFALSFGIVGKNKLYRADDSHLSGCVHVEIVS